jgi:hypothetical protein
VYTFSHCASVRLVGVETTTMLICLDVSYYCFSLIYFHFVVDSLLMAYQSQSHRKFSCVGK